MAVDELVRDITVSFICGNRILKAFANSLDPDETPQNVASHLDPNLTTAIQYSQRGTNIILGHATARIVGTRRPRRVFTRRIAEARGIDPRKDAESILTSRTFTE
ncbi:hypothetical protein DPMN_166098 [Dreissena polymorpha]|uniref:Uncharacterized protein n=1 Tax=Dreissena polymorpha TaxID=45954 RepID=A0A9D4ITV3_DREPO|nr:hypothetical protein DPMN_166098 [Dreissena polymorpha]